MKAFFRIAIYGFILSCIAIPLANAQSLALVKTGSKWYYIDKTGKVVIEKLFDEAADRFTNGLAPVKLKGEWGYINPSGKMVISNKFSRAYNFYNEKALVQKENKWQIINTKGKTLLQLPEVKTIDTIADGIAKVQTSNGAAYILPSGKMLWPDKNLTDLQIFTNGRARVKKNGKFGYIDTAGRLAVACVYDNAGFFNDNIACVETGGFYQVIDTSGETIEPLTHLADVAVFSKGIAPLQIQGNYVVYELGAGAKAKTTLQYGSVKQSTYVYPFRGGAARFFSSSIPTGFRFGYLLQDGKLLHAFEYEWANDFSDGLAAVKLNGRYGYINLRGEMIINPAYEEAHNFYPVQ